MRDKRLKTLLLRPWLDAEFGISPPLSILYLASALKQNGKSVKVVDNRADISHFRCDADLTFRDKRAVEKLLDRLSRESPHLVGMTVYSRELTETAAFCRYIKENLSDVRIVLGGPHPTACPEDTLKQIPECDFVIRGEAEKALTELVDALERNGDLRSVPNLCFRHNGEIITNERVPAIKDLDSLPFPAREEVAENYENGVYYNIIFGRRTDNIITSRSCPYSCSFCFKVERRYRSRAPENVVAEIVESVTKYRAQTIQIMDDSFTIDRDRCTKILRMLIKERLPCEFKVRSRVDAVDRELLRMMHRAGVRTITYGFESGSQRMLDRFRKRTTVEQNYNACKLTKSAGMACNADIMLFFPGETPETIKETEEFLRRAKPSRVQVFVFCPLPETKGYLEAKADGTLVGDWGVGKPAPWVRIPWLPDKDAMEKRAKQVYLRYYMQPGPAVQALKIAANALRNPRFFFLPFYMISKRRHY